MGLFVSSFTLRLDAKGRVSVPAAFRAALHATGFQGLFCYPLPDRPAIDAGGDALLDEIRLLIESYPPFSDTRQKFSAALFGLSETLKIDGEGRVVLSEQLKQHAGISSTVGFVGLGHKFQIWEPERLKLQFAEAAATLRALRQTGGAGS